MPGAAADAHSRGSRHDCRGLPVKRRPSVTVAAVDAKALETEALGAISSAASLTDLDDARVRYLGRKSELKQALRDVRDRETGMTLNAARATIEEALASRRA